MASPKLRAVKPDETATPPAKLTITEATKTGTIRQQLVALSERIAKTVEDPTCPPRDLAALSRRLMEITKEVAAIDAQAREHDEDQATPDEEWTAV